MIRAPFLNLSEPLVDASKMAALRRVNDVADDLASTFLFFTSAINEEGVSLRGQEHGSFSLLFHLLCSIITYMLFCTHVCLGYLFLNTCCLNKLSPFCALAKYRPTNIAALTYLLRPSGHENSHKDQLACDRFP